MKWRALEISPALAPAWLGQRPVFIPIDEAEEARVVEREGERIFGFDLDEAIATLECEGWADEMRSPTQRLPFPYDRLPWPLRGLGALALFAPRRLVRPRHQPAWPIAPALDVLRFSAAIPSTPSGETQPGAFPSPVMWTPWVAESPGRR